MILKLPHKFHIIPLLNPFIKYEISNLSNNFCGINKFIKRERPVIVSLTSYEERFEDLPVTLYSLMSQSLKPDRIILWLDAASYNLSNLPYEITEFIKYGLEIRFVKDIKSYTKIIYALREFSDSIIVTADDDIYYRKDWLKKLYYSYIAHPEDIQVHRAHRVIIKKDKLTPYESWKKHVSEETARYDNFLTGVGGVLYPPKCFSGEVFREDIFLKYAPYADDIWLWIMALVSGRKIRVVKSHYRHLVLPNFVKHFWGKSLYKKNKAGGNDEQLNNLMKLYGRNVLNCIARGNDND